LVPSFLGFEARLVPGHVSGLGFGLGRGNGGGLGFGGDAGGNKNGEAFPAIEEKEQLAPVEEAVTGFGRGRSFSMGALWRLWNPAG
jgi:hypothetical protein